MYGYNHMAEYERLRNAAEQGEKLMQEILHRCPANADHEISTFSAWEFLRFATRILEIRRNVTHDGSGWEPRPIDLLARSHIDVDGNPSDYAQMYLGEKEKKYQLALDRCKGWEETCQLFLFEKNFSDNLEKRRRKDKKEEKPFPLECLSEKDVFDCGKGPMKTLFIGMKNLRSKQKEERVTYDVFDSKISYTERIARWHEDKVWGLSGLQVSYSSDVNRSIVAIPDLLYIDLIKEQIGQAGNNSKVQSLIRFTEFCAMLYRHLKGMGVSPSDLFSRQGNNTLTTDYWALPGKSAFGSYQSDVQPEQFFDSVEALIRSMDNPPVKLLKINDRWMAWMDAELFLAFENSEKTIGNIQGNEEMENRVAADQQVYLHPDDPAFDTLSEAEKYNYWLSEYQRVLKKKTCAVSVNERTAPCGGNPEEERNCLTVVDDGSYLPCEAISAYIRGLYRQETEKTKDPELEWFSLFKKEASQRPLDQMWRESREEERIEWLKQAINIFKEENDIKKLKDGKTVVFPLKMIKANQYGKTVKRYSSCLLIGFCCYVNDNQECVLLAPDAINQETFAKADGKAFLQYCSDIESGKLQLYAARADENTLYVMTIEIGEEERRLLRGVLDAADMEAESGRPDNYNLMFEKAMALTEPIHDLTGKCSVEYLSQWKSGNDIDNLKAFAQRALYWHAMRTSRLPDNFYKLRKLWQNDRDVSEFLTINKLMAHGWINTRVIFKKSEPGTLDFQNICTKLTQEEDNLISVLQNRNDRRPEHSRKTEAAWHHLIHMGMLVLWNCGFSKGSESRKKKIEEPVFSYSNPAGNTNAGDEKALCFLMFAIHYINKMQAGTGIVCRYKDGIWYFDDTPLQISSAEWDKFWSKAERILRGEIKLSKAYLFHDIQAGDHQLILSIYEQEKNSKIRGQKKSINRGNVFGLQPER